MIRQLRFISRLPKPWVHGSASPKIGPFRILNQSLLSPGFSLYILQCVLVLHLTTKYLGYVAFTIGPSMLPTLSAKGDGVLVSTLHRRGKGITVGDCVDFEHPMVPGVGAIKRVMGMPGDFVEKEESGVELSPEGQLLRRRGTMIQIPEGHCWLLGDNIPDSRDSRAYGPIPLALIKGKVVARVWPPSDVKWIENALQPVS